MPLAPEITVEDQWPDSVRWRLPRRPLGWPKLIGLPLIALGLYTVACVLAMLTIGGNIAFDMKPVRLPLMFPVTLLLGLTTRGGWLLIWWGLALLIGRRDLIVTPQALRTVERVGPLWWGKSWPVNTITQISTTPISAEQTNPEWLANWNAMALLTTAGKRGMLAWGYPLEWLDALAQHLVEYANRAVALMHDGAEEDLEPIVAVSELHRQDDAGLDDELSDEDDWDDEDDEDFDDEEEDAPREQPADSVIEVERFDDGVTIKVPAAGLWRGSSGLFFFALLWNGILTFITMAMGWAASATLFDPNNNDRAGAWAMLAFLSLFWLVGIGIMIAAINMGARKAAIAIAGDALMVIQTGPFGTKRREWLLADVSDISVGPSGLQVNEVDVVELQIFDADKKKFGMLCGRKDAELYWLAGVLREAAGLTPRRPQAEVPAAPPVEE